MTKSDSLLRTASLDLSAWDGESSLLEYLFETKQAIQLKQTSEGTVLTVVNQFCIRGHNLAERGVYESTDSRTLTVAKTCRKCKYDRDKERNRLKAAGKRPTPKGEQKENND